jgi:hypothetical protein
MEIAIAAVVRVAVLILYSTVNLSILVKQPAGFAPANLVLSICLMLPASVVGTHPHRSHGAGLLNSLTDSSVF